MARLKHLLWKHRWTAISLSIVVPAGFYCKLYSGPVANWVNNSLAGTLYEVFWCLLLFAFFGNGRSWTIAASVLVATCILEFLQLWHPPFLELVRSHFIGRAILGTTFTWLDFPYYVVGCGIGWIWLRQLQGGSKRPGGSAERDG